MKQFRYVIMWMTGLWFSTQALAQSGGDFVLQRDAGGLYLTHTVAPKENFYSIGRLFNISPKVIAPYNGLQLTGGLTIGQKIKIPLKDQNFTAARKNAPGEVLVPLYRADADKKVLAGFLKVVKGQSPLATGGRAVSTPAVAAAGSSAAPSTAVPVVSAPVAVAATSGAVTKPVKKTPPPKATAAKTAAVAKTAVPDKGDILAGPTQAPAQQPPVQQTPAQSAPAEQIPSAPVAATVTPVSATAPVNTGVGRYAGEGTFETDYLSQTDNGRKARSTGGLAGVFKSTSGWDNGKFYALMNNVERGTIVRVTNLSNNKVVFAKVLGNICDIKDNAGMVVVLSDAAVAQLGANTDRFTSELSYSK